MNVWILYLQAALPLHVALQSEGLHFNAEFANKLHERHASASMKENDKNYPIFIAAGDNKGNAEPDRLAMARKGFGIPNTHLSTITMYGKDVKKDLEKKTEAGSYKKYIISEKKYTTEYKYEALEGQEYKPNYYWDFNDKVWNKYETLHEHWQKHEYEKNWPEPTEDERIAGVYGDRDDCNGYCKNKNIYYRQTFYIPTIKSAYPQKFTDYNGMIIISAHGNLLGDVVVNGKLMSAKNLGKEILDFLKKGKDANGNEQWHPMPKWIVLLACGVGQEEDFIQDLSEVTKAQVFGSKFVISRTGSEPQMEFNYNSAGSTTGWSLNGITAYDGIGDSLPKGVVLCNKLRMEFTDMDKERMEKEQDDGGKNYKLMKKHPYYFTMSDNTDKFEESECVAAFPKPEESKCENVGAMVQQSCCKSRNKNRNTAVLESECCNGAEVIEKESCEDICPGHQTLIEKLCAKP